MRTEKQKKLIDGGWKIGNAEEFLELTEAEAAYITMKLSVGQQIRELRKASSMTQVELAKRVRSSQSRIAKMETGDPSISLDLLIRTVLALGATQEQVAKYLMHRRAS